MGNSRYIAKRVIVVVNGHLDEESIECLLETGIEVRLRENQGFDFGAWREVYFSLTNAEIEEIDEIILCNNSCYGPVFDLSLMWEEMNKRECDFWGIYEHPETAKVPRHIQSYFLILKKRVISSSYFKKLLWDLKAARSWKEAVEIETKFTILLEHAGFKSDALIKNCPYIDDPSCFLPDYLLEQGSPFLKRKAFTIPHVDKLEKTFGFAGKRALNWITQKTKYPVENIIDDLCHTLPASQITQSLQLVISLPEGNLFAEESYEYKVAAICFSYYEDLIEYNLGYLKNLPNNALVVVVMVNESLKKSWENYIYEKDLTKRLRFLFRVQQNRGRNESAYWVTCRDIIENNDFICCIHDKKSPKATNKIVGHEWYRHCCDHLLGSSQSVYSILSTFEKNDWIGLIEPIEPLFEHILETVIAKPWDGNKQEAKELYKKLKLSIPFDEYPRAPWGGMFWVRGQAMRALYRHEWKYEDFPEEPLQPNGTLLHALERLYPSLVQEEGYVTAQVCLSSQIGAYYANLFSIIQNFTNDSLQNFYIETSESKKHSSYIKKKAVKAIININKKERMHYLSEFFQSLKVYCHKKNHKY